MVPEGWKAYSLIDITKWSSGSTPSKSENDFWGGDIPWISAVSMKGIFYSDSDLKVTEKALKHSAKVANENDILLLVRGSMLWNKIPVGIATRAMAFNQDVKCIKADTKKVDVRFLLYWFLAKEKHLLGMVTGTGIGAGKLDTSELQSLDIYLPCLSEQKKIAKILSTWDKAISTTEKLIATSQQQKKALMQQLLTGKKRLVNPETGKVFDGEWYETTMASLFSISAGKSKSKFISDSGQYLIVDMGSISREGKLIAFKKTSHDSDFLSLGQLVMPKDDIGGGQIIGRTAYIPESGKFILSDHVYLLEPKTVNSLFASYLINSWEINKQLRSKANGTAQLGLGKKDVEKQKLVVPKSLQEQQKIASVLTAADKEIEFLEAKLAHLKEEKKALMQQLLTGKRRVKVSETEAA